MSDADRCLILEQRVVQLETHRDVLQAQINQAADRVSALEDEIATTADEAFGPFPVQSADENLTAIERGIFELKQRLEAFERMNRSRAAQIVDVPLVTLIDPVARTVSGVDAVAAPAEPRELTQQEPPPEPPPPAPPSDLVALVRAWANQEDVNPNGPPTSSVEMDLLLWIMRHDKDPRLALLMRLPDRPWRCGREIVVGENLYRSCAMDVGHLKPCSPYRDGDVRPATAAEKYAVGRAAADKRRADHDAGLHRPHFDPECEKCTCARCRSVGDVCPHGLCGNCTTIDPCRARSVPEPPPVDRAAITTLHGTPVDELRQQHAAQLTGQHADYIVLTNEELARGFVRPVRRTYLHEKCGSTTTMGESLAKTYARDPKFYGSTFCCACNGHFPVGPDGEFVWDGTTEKVGT